MINSLYCLDVRAEEVALEFGDVLCDALEEMMVRERTVNYVNVMGMEVRGKAVLLSAMRMW